MKIENDNNQISEVKEAEMPIVAHKHRLERSALAKKLLIKGENLKEFEEMRTKILEEILIHTEIEKILVEKIIFTQWKIRRAMEIEKNLLNQLNEINDDERYGSPNDSPPRQRVRNIKKVSLNTLEIQQIIQYQLELEKVVQKALERLREEQSLYPQTKEVNQ